MTSEQAVAAVEKYGSLRAAAKALGCCRKTLGKAINGKVVRTMAETEKQTIKVAPASGGFDIKGKQLMAKKPSDVWGPRFNALKLDVAYLPTTLAEQWGNSIETTRQKARAAGAVRYMEHEGQYIEVIVNPKTRGGK